MDAREAPDTAGAAHVQQRVVAARGTRRMPGAPPARVSELQGLTVEKDLKPLCRQYGLPVSGKKADLVQRILEHEFDAVPSS